MTTPVTPAVDDVNSVPLVNSAESLGHLPELSLRDSSPSSTRLYHLPGLRSPLRAINSLQDTCWLANPLAGANAAKRTAILRALRSGNVVALQETHWSLACGVRTSRYAPSSDQPRAPALADAPNEALAY